MVERKGFPNRMTRYCCEILKEAIGRGMSKNPQWKLTRVTGGDPEVAIQFYISGKTMNQYFNLKSES